MAKRRNFSAAFKAQVAIEAVRIEELKSRVRVALPSAYPYQPALISIAARITAQGP